jgi:hypothetical protein
VGLKWWKKLLQWLVELLGKKKSSLNTMKHKCNKLYINLLKPEDHLNNIKKSSSYLKENTFLKINWMMVFKEIITVHSENHTLC